MFLLLELWPVLSLTWFVKACSLTWCWIRSFTTSSSFTLILSVFCLSWIWTVPATKTHYLHIYLGCWGKSTRDEAAGGREKSETQIWATKVGQLDMKSRLKVNLSTVVPAKDKNCSDISWSYKQTNEPVKRN